MLRYTIEDPSKGIEPRIAIGDRSIVQARLVEEVIGLRADGVYLQILHYGVGGEYQPHFDYFEPEESGSAAHLRRGGQRISTLIMYLNDVDAGGETIFPDLGLTVAARKGGGVYFSYCDSQGNLDRRTLHGGAPVQRGEKWISTHWLRQGVYQ